MNNIANYIKQRLSLRDPLQESLDIVATLTDRLSLKKEISLPDELAKVKALYPTCTDFEREFPSLAFSIATGVGKTRLMGACIAYLHLAKGVRNFFVLAPNLTIYNKLIEDFGNPAYHKYVFAGISEFVHNRPVIITGDNYAQQGALFGDQEIRINIFNISKFNSETRGTNQGGVSLAPRIKRLSEYLGQSYWEYLSNLDDLVILMDEAHRYHADRSKNAINELKPILGLELTATPIDDNGNQFKNIVYEYSLAKALADGKYVKNPAIAKRKDFQRGSMSDRELEIIKLEDAISIHQDTKKELEVYSLNENKKLVKPFILVVCKDTTHAREIYDLINSNEFYEGEYRDKVLQIDSTTKKDGGIEEQFLGLESPENQIEVVIHVNMLKEGWDVPNLYTIVPLRAANAAVLVEQTIGRGLRLPFNASRTGVDKIDKLTVVAHENFDAIIAAANDPNSVLNKMNFVEISFDDLKSKTEVITSKAIIETRYIEDQKRIDKMVDIRQKQVAQNNVDAKKAIIQVLPDFNSLPGLTKFDDLHKEEVKRKVMRQVEENLAKGQGNLFVAQILEEAKEVYDAIVKEYKNNIIEIPRMVLSQADRKITFSDFDLDTSELTYHALDQEIIRMNLKDHGIDMVQAKSSGYYGDPVKLIISELINYSDIDYDDNAELLYQLATQAFTALRSNLNTAEDINKVVFQFKTAIAEKIYRQMKQRFEISGAEYVDPTVFPFVKIEPWNFSALINEGYRDYRETITPTSSIPRYVFRGFEKACHFEYKFDSKTEQDLAFILENDKQIMKWLRPSPNQFRIYWDHNSKRYEPDFIVETADAIYMLETKMSTQMDALDVQSKKQAAEKYCKHATDFTSMNEGKPWKYGIIPHSSVSRTSSFAFLIAQFVK
jgi:type III restriction enzyme